MKNINDFVDEGINCKKTLDEVIQEYKQLLKKREEIKRKLEKFSSLLKTSKNENGNILSFYEKKFNI